MSRKRTLIREKILEVTEGAKEPISTVELIEKVYNVSPDQVSARYFGSVKHRLRDRVRQINKEKPVLVKCKHTGTYRRVDL